MELSGSEGLSPAFPVPIAEFDCLRGNIFVEPLHATNPIVVAGSTVNRTCGHDQRGILYEAHAA